MPSIETNRKNFEAAKEQGNIVPVEKSVVINPIPPIPTYPAAPNANLRTPLPAISVQQPDIQRQWQTGATPQQRISPPSWTSNPVVGAQAASQTIILRSTDGGLLLETNNLKNASQTILNLLAGGNISLSSDSQGGVTITGTAGGDDLTHGDAVWEHDSAYVELRDDFVPCINDTATFGPGSATSVGELGWFLLGGTTNMDQQGGGPPYIGQFAWENNGVVNNAGILLLNGVNGMGANSSTVFSSNAFALLEKPGWKMTWVFKHEGGTQSTSDFQISKKAFYIGLSGPLVAGIANVVGGGGQARPDIFIGLRYDTSATPGALTLTSVANASGGNTVYTGTITGGANGAHIGITFVVAGFTNGVNNGTFVCVDSSGTTLTLVNASGAAETHAATATGPSLSDSFYTFEAVINPQYQNGVRHNKQGQTFVTSVAPTQGVWHRLDMTCSSAGVVKMTLDGSATNTFTVTVPQASVTTSAQASCNAHVGRISSAAGTSGVNSVPPFSAGSVITVTGFTGGNAPLNGTWNLFYGDGLTMRFDAPAVANIGNNSAGATVVGYPSLTPVCTHGNDDTGSPTGNTMKMHLDFFSFVWNPNLGPGGTPNVTKPRYW